MSFRAPELCRKWVGYWSVSHTNDLSELAMEFAFYPRPTAAPKINSKVLAGPKAAIRKGSHRQPACTCHFGLRVRRCTKLWWLQRSMCPRTCLIGSRTLKCGCPVLTTFSTNPDADILTAANGYTDVVHLAVDFNLLTARPARTMTGRVG
jgi:hypothetical protein